VRLYCQFRNLFAAGSFALVGARFGTLVSGTRILGWLTAATVIGGVAHAATIQPTSVTASSEFTTGFDGAAVNTINGSGLPIGFSPASAHDGYSTGNHWTTASDTAPTASFINWFFAVPQTLDRMYVWNKTSSPGAAAADASSKLSMSTRRRDIVVYRDRRSHNQSRRRQVWRRRAVQDDEVSPQRPTIAARCSTSPSISATSPSPVTNIADVATSGYIHGVWGRASGN
jgi:hypothetical protein